MATLVREHAPDDFAEILAELQRKPLPVNRDRRVAGAGRSQAFGLQRRWSYIPFLGRMTWQRPELWALLLAFAQKFDIVDFDAIQVNDSYKSAPHRDAGNYGLSYIVGFGDYVAGELDVEGTKYDIRHKGHVFNGSELTHSTSDFQGQRYCLVFFKIVWPSKFIPYQIQTRLVEDGLLVSNTYNNEEVVLDRKGKVVRTIKEAEPREYVVRLSRMGQTSRTGLAPALTPALTPIGVMTPV